MRHCHNVSLTYMSLSWHVTVMACTIMMQQCPEKSLSWCMPCCITVIMCHWHDMSVMWCHCHHSHDVITHHCHEMSFSRHVTDMMRQSWRITAMTYHCHDVSLLRHITVITCHSWCITGMKHQSCCIIHDAVTCHCHVTDMRCHLQSLWHVSLVASLSWCVSYVSLLSWHI